MRYVWVIGKRQADTDGYWRNIYFKQFERRLCIQTLQVSEAYRFKSLDAVFDFVKANPEYADSCIIQRFVDEYLNKIAGTIDEVRVRYAYSKKPGWLVYDGDER